MVSLLQGTRTGNRDANHMRQYVILCAGGTTEPRGERAQEPLVLVARDARGLALAVGNVHRNDLALLLMADSDAGL